MGDQLSVSVITIVYNGKEYLEQTIRSIIGQSYSNFEYIIIDGGSIDGSLEIIEKYQSSINYWQSVPDNGIADAMNKGLKVSKGEYIVFIHADDYLVDNQVIEKVAQQINNEDMLIGNIIFGSDSKLLKPRGFNYWMNFKTGVYHQAAFCHRRVFEQIGGFDIRIKIAMDYDFFLRAYRNRFKMKKTDLVIAVVRDTGISSQSDWPGLKQRFLEEKSVHYKNCNSLFLKLIYNLYWLFYCQYRLCRSKIKW